MNDTWSKADLHMHSSHSDGLARIPEIMDYVQDHTDLKVIAITDHNTIDGALFAQSLAEMYDFEVVVGEEVSSKSGHIIGLYLTENIPAGLSAAETISRINDQNGVAIMPHPFSSQGVFGPLGTSGFGAAVNDLAFHALEVYNSMPFLVWANKIAAKMFAGGTGLAATGGSDAHMLKSIGKGYTMFRGTTADELRASLDRLETRGEATGRGGLGVMLRYAFHFPQIRRRQAWNWDRCKASE